ncbi:hypothetical protein T484DRAFT_3521762 [Baffinella frigidus]|nr:hypothetical protein T484DRAFT_3521762 [Cryptophyta sp. CCMP2293]
MAATYILLLTANRPVGSMMWLILRRASSSPPLLIHGPDRSPETLSSSSPHRKSRSAQENRTRRCSPHAAPLPVFNLPARNALLVLEGSLLTSPALLPPDQSPGRASRKR